jgi:hypothetical protein
MPELEAVKRRSDQAMNTEGETNGYLLANFWYQSAKDVPPLIAELEAAHKVIAALHRWEEMPGHFFGATPAEGREVGLALDAYDKAVQARAASTGGGSR